MRIFLFFLFLIFFSQSWTKADEITDFEIEGISIGNSLLDHYSEEYVNNAFQNATYYKDRKFAEIFVDLQNKQYDFLQVALKSNDKQFIVHSIMLLKDFPNQINECKKQKEKIIYESKDILINTERVDEDRASLSDKTGNSFVYISTFYPKKGGFFNITCNDYGFEMSRDHGWVDALTLSIGSDEFKEYLLSNPY